MKKKTWILSGLFFVALLLVLYLVSADITPSLNLNGQNRFSITNYTEIRGVQNLTLGSGTNTLDIYHNGSTNVVDSKLQNITFIDGINFAELKAYPTACPAGSYITALGDSVTCTTVTASANNVYSLVNDSQRQLLNYAWGSTTHMTWESSNISSGVLVKLIANTSSGAIDKALQIFVTGGSFSADPTSSNMSVIGSVDQTLRILTSNDTGSDVPINIAPHDSTLPAIVAHWDRIELNVANVTNPSYAGAGIAHACFDANGRLYRGNLTGCP